MAKENIVYEKSKSFAIKTVNLYKQLRDDKHEYVMSQQLLKCGTSIGANIAESECAISRNDFLSKVYIALKESVECLYWLELLYNTKYLEDNEYYAMREDCNEIRRILSATTKTLTDK